jgi:hypothetical protein
LPSNGGMDFYRNRPERFVFENHLHRLRGLKGILKKRKAVRYKLCLPVIFKWTDEHGRPVQEGGFTRDISTVGSYISCPKLPPIQTPLALEILLPPNKKVLSERLKLEATVEIVRVGTDAEEQGFAAVGELAMHGSQYQGRKRRVSLNFSNTCSTILPN